jgi:hypothetical protein
LEGEKKTLLQSLKKHEGKMPRVPKELGISREPTYERLETRQISLGDIPKEELRRRKVVKEGIRRINEAIEGCKVELDRCKREKERFSRMRPTKVHTYRHGIYGKILNKWYYWKDKEGSLDAEMGKLIGEKVILEYIQEKKRAVGIDGIFKILKKGDSGLFQNRDEIRKAIDEIIRKGLPLCWTKGGRIHVRGNGSHGPVLGLSDKRMNDKKLPFLRGGVQEETGLGAKEKATF